MNSSNPPGRQSVFLPHFLAAVVLVAIPYVLFSVVVPIGRDSGVFMYTGWMMTGGGAPYVDSWDHKGPLLYLFNAAGLVLAGPAGVILLEGTLLTASLVAAMLLWERVLPRVAVLLTALLFALYFYATFEGGNMTESWYIPFSLLAYSLAFVHILSDDAGRARHADWLAVLVGVGLGVAALTRPNNGLGLSLLAVAFLAGQGQRRVRWLAVMLLALAVVVLPVLLYLARAGAFPAFAEQYWVFNTWYVGSTGMADRVQAFHELFRAMIFSGLGLSMLVLLGRWVFSQPAGSNGRFNRLVWLMLAVVSAEMASQSLSGRPYRHYISLLAPSLTVLVAALLAVDGARSPEQAGLRAAWRRGWVIVPVLAVASLASAHGVFTTLVTGTRLHGSARNQLASYLQAKTAVTDPVLVHGAETWLLVAAGRRSPTSITYYYPAVAGFKDSLLRYVDETVAARPLYIVETAESCGLSLRSCADAKLFDRLKGLLEADYALDAELQGFRFWRRKG